MALCSKMLAAQDPPILEPARTVPFFPFLRLPRELREMIYDAFRNSDTKPKPGPTATFKRGTYEFAPPGSPNTRRYSTSVPFFYFPEYSAHYGHRGLLGYHGQMPPLNLSLTCKQIDTELWEHFAARKYEIGPLTPRADRHRYDPTYGELAETFELWKLRRIFLRIHVSAFRESSELGPDLGNGSRRIYPRFEELGLEDCVLKLESLSQKLVIVLKEKATGLRTITIEWKDAFPEDERWDIKARILQPFGTLKGIQMKVSWVTVEESKRARVQKLLQDTLADLSAVG